MKLNIQLFATNLSVGGSYTQAWQPGNTVGGLSNKYNWRIVVNYISRDVVANTSYLRLRFQEYGTWGDYSGMNSTYSRLKISLNNGSSYTELAYKKTPSYTKGDTETKIDVYYTVNHNANGTSPTIKVQASNETSNTASYAPANKTVTTEAITLTAIPRESKLNPISDFAIATSTVIPITFTKYVDTYTHKLNVKIGSTTIKSNFTITTPYNLQFTSSEVTAIKNAFSGSSTPVTFTLSTYNGNTLLGTSVQTATGIDSSRVMGLSRYKSNSGYKYCINDALNKNLDDGLQVGGTLYVDGYDYSTVQSGTLSITKTSGNASCTGSYIKCGHFMAVEFVVVLSGATNAGNDIFVGKSTTFTPRKACTTVGFLGARSIICNWGTDNVITVRNASSSNIGSSATNTIRCRGMVIV